MAKAKERLSTTTLTVSEIAYELGFEHLQSFSKLFKSQDAPVAPGIQGLFYLTERQLKGRVTNRRSTTRAGTVPGGIAGIFSLIIKILPKNKLYI
ncbi:MAG: hypothetical protein WKG07_37150 [Hymenobacter sp.]